jgi:hypothetical protein
MFGTFAMKAANSMIELDEKFEIRMPVNQCLANSSPAIKDSIHHSSLT